MKRCVIFCAAQFDSLLNPIREGDYVIAADGGFRHTETLGIRPDAILGDFDSLGYTPAGANVFPVEKDDTDAMLAVRRGLSLGCREFLIYGGLDGPRLDHTLANIQTLSFLTEHGAYGYLVGQDFMLTVVKDGAVRFPAGKRGTISVFCVGSDAQGVTEQGLYYPLEDAVLTSSFPLGASNHFTEKEAEISVRKGRLLLLWDRQNGFPERI